jgi:NAD kinase
MGAFFQYRKVIIVTRKTVLDELIERHGTHAQAKFLALNRGQSFQDIEDAHRCYYAALSHLKQSVPHNVRLQIIERSFLPTFLFSHDDLVVTLGQDGLVVNVAKYIEGQPLMAFNPDPRRIDGVLLPFAMDDAADAIDRVLYGHTPADPLTMARVSLDDGQTLHALNDLFIGVRSHTSARYQLSYRGTREDQSSSGIIVSTGAGSTGWFRSIVTASAGLADGFMGTNATGSMRDQFRFNPLARELRFAVREPFVSRTTSANVVYGHVLEGESLEIVSQTPHGGIIFSDGMEADFLKFESGMTARITVSDRCVNLIRHWK